MSIFSFLMKLWNWRDRNGVYHSFFKYSSVKPKSENEKTMCYFIIGLWIWYKKICFVFSYFHFMLRPKKGTETSQGLNLILIFITLYYRKYDFFFISWFWFPYWILKEGMIHRLKCQPGFTSLEDGGDKDISLNSTMIVFQWIIKKTNLRLFH